MHISRHLHARSMELADAVFGATPGDAPRPTHLYNRHLGPITALRLHRPELNDFSMYTASCEHARMSALISDATVRAPALDTMLIYESSGLPSAGQMGGWHSKYARSNFGVIPHTSQFDATFVRNARQYVQYIYVQNDTLPNPWDSVPATFGNLLAALE